MAYHIQIEQFEGPLDLLLSLIEKEKLDITQVSLAKVADQFLEYLRQESTISLETLSSFLAVAARLILIKSRALLPVLTFSDDEEESIYDLEDRLKEYKRFREAAMSIGRLFHKRQSSHARECLLETQKVFYPPQELTALSLRAHFESVLGEIPLAHILPEEEIRSIITLEEKILSFQQHFTNKVEASFSDLIHATSDRLDVIVSFLALLELVKQQIIFVSQAKYFSDIRIKRI